MIDYLSNKIRLKLNKLTYTDSTIVSIHIVYKITASSSNSDDPTVRNSLFGAVRLTKNANIDNYKYSGYEIGFDRRGSFSLPGGEFGSNVIVFGVDMSSSTHVDNKKRTF